MTVSYAEYEFHHGYIHNWLVAGPQEIPLGIDPKQFDPQTAQIAAEKYQTQKYEFSNSPVERGTLEEGIFNIGDYKGEWNYTLAGEDHLIDLSASFQALAYVRGWAYTHLDWEDDSNVTISLAAYGPVDVWVNKKHAFQSKVYSNSYTRLEFNAQLKKGINRVLIRFANIATPSCLLAVAMKVIDQVSTGKVQIPSLIPSISRRNQLEEAYNTLYLERDIFAFDQYIALKFPKELGEHASVDVRAQTITGRIYGQAEDRGEPGSDVKLGTPPSLPSIPFQILVMPRAWEYYESQIRITRRFNLWHVGRQRFSTQPYAHPEDRKIEALLYASTVERSVFAEISKIALGKWGDIENKYLKGALASIAERRSGSEINLLGLFGVLARFGDQKELPQWIAQEIHEIGLHFHYSEFEFNSSSAEINARSDRDIIIATLKILAGQLYPKEQFLDSGLSGDQLREIGEKSALEWIQKRGKFGFACWDSKEIISQVLAALSYLIDISQNEEIWELASVLMDKILFSIAVNSFQGVYGSSQGWGSTTGIISGLMEHTSGITRLMWGIGIFNIHLEGLVSLACMNKYELPPIIAEIAADTAEEMLNKEQQAAGEYPINKITYRTPHYLLSSAQSYRPGECGGHEHIWQATLGQQATVFVNHPGCSNNDDQHIPNYWVGNATLPRVAQYKNILIAIYNNSEARGLDFTHAFFPTIEFDEFEVVGNTALGRKADAFIALTASNGLDLLKLGPTAHREIRSSGNQNIWICQLGSSSKDENFQSFKEKVLNQQIRVNDLVVDLKLANHDTLSFGWDKPLLYNGEEQPLSSYPHFENPFASSTLPCNEIEISNNDYSLRLSFSGEPEQ
jgi:hypothetical protein